MLSIFMFGKKPALLVKTWLGLTTYAVCLRAIETKLAIIGIDVWWTYNMSRGKRVIS
jgi:hypothetical protein